LRLVALGEPDEGGSQMRWRGFVALRQADLGEARDNVPERAIPRLRAAAGRWFGVRIGASPVAAVRVVGDAFGIRMERARPTRTGWVAVSTSSFVTEWRRSFSDMAHVAFELRANLRMDPLPDPEATGGGMRWHGFDPDPEDPAVRALDLRMSGSGRRVPF